VFCPSHFSLKVMREMTTKTSAVPGPDKVIKFLTPLTILAVQVADMAK